MAKEQGLASGLGHSKGNPDVSLEEVVLGLAAQHRGADSGPWNRSLCEAAQGAGLAVPW